MINLLIWNTFHFLRIIPKPSSGCINKIFLTILLILIITVGLFICYFDFYIYPTHYGVSYTFSETITYLLNDILIPLQSLLVIKGFASLEDLQTDLKTLSLYPKHPLYCLIITSIHFTSILILIYYDFVSDESFYGNLDKCYYVVMLSTMLLCYLLNFLLVSAARLVIGVAVNRLCKGIDESLPIVGFVHIHTEILLCFSISSL